MFNLSVVFNNTNNLTVFADNIIVKFGRFIPNSPHIYDTLLGVELASNNQYAKIITGDNNAS